MTDTTDPIATVRKLLKHEPGIFSRQEEAALRALADEVEQLRAERAQPETGDERDRAAWCWTRNPHGRLHCGRLAGHDGPHKRGEREWHDAENGADRD